LASACLLHSKIQEARPLARSGYCPLDCFCWTVRGGMGCLLGETTLCCKCIKNIKNIVSYYDNAVNSIFQKERVEAEIRRTQRTRKAQKEGKKQDEVMAEIDNLLPRPR